MLIFTKLLSKNPLAAPLCRYDLTKVIYYIYFTKVKSIIFNKK